MWELQYSRALGLASACHEGGLETGLALWRESLEELLIVTSPSPKDSAWATAAAPLLA